MTVVEAADVPRKLDDRGLHAETDTEERHPALSCEADCLDHSVDAADAEATWHEQPIVVGENAARGLLVGKAVTRHPRDVDAHIIGNAAMDERFLYALVAVDEIGVLAHDGNAHALVWRCHALHHLAPRGQLRLWAVESE